jgi:RNA polymerase sigma factor (TIGR02999 family)
MAMEPDGHTLQPTALVHEAYLRLLGDEPIKWANRAHFFAAAARAMRRILIERARRQQAAKRGGGARRITLVEGAAATASEDCEPVDLIALDDALAKLEKQDRRAADLVSLRYFAGLTIEETAQAMDLSPATVKREWNYAKAWLYAEIGGKP